jgi:hypothetical protein
MLSDVEQNLREALLALDSARSVDPKVWLRQAQRLCRLAEQQIEEIIREMEAGGTLH